jgi:hypothetical protein
MGMSRFGDGYDQSPQPHSLFFCCCCISLQMSLCLMPDSSKHLFMEKFIAHGTDISVNGIARRLEGSAGRYVEGGSITPSESHRHLNSLDFLLWPQYSRIL